MPTPEAASKPLLFVDNTFSQSFVADSIIQPSLAIVYFGGNDSMIPIGSSPHVPLEEFINNMAKIAFHIKCLSTTTRSIFLSVPPVNSDQIRETHPGLEMVRTMENCKIYSDAIIDLCRKIGIEYVDLFNAIQKRPDWRETSFTDGIHFTATASRVVFDEIEKVINRANWLPSLAAASMPEEFAHIVIPRASQSVTSPILD